jgi:nicotinamidase-related amidase
MKTQPATLPLQKTRPEVALLVIDVQRALFKQSTPIYQAEQLLNTICALVERAHLAGVPVFYIQHSNNRLLPAGTDGCRLHPRLSPEARDTLVQKKHGSAFEDTDLGRQFEDRDVGTVVITGLVTNGCVRATCLDAHRLGYRVILVGDGHSSYHKKAGKLIAEWNQKLGEKAAQVMLAQEIDFGSIA